MGTSFGRIVDFEFAFARRQAADVSAVPAGIVVRHPDFPTSHNNNRLLVTSVAQDLLDVVDQALAGFDHRLVTVYDDAAGLAFAPTATAAGYVHTPLITMAFDGAVPPAPDIPVADIDLDTLMPSLRDEWRETLPNEPAGNIDQLARRVSARLKGADEVHFLGVLDSGRTVLSRADLYLQDGVAQIEFVATRADHRGHGYSRAVLREALRRAAGSELTFIIAEEADWPGRWYGRLGFTQVGRIHEFLRA